MNARLRTEFMFFTLCKFKYGALMLVNLENYGNTRLIHILYTYIHASMLLAVTKSSVQKFLKFLSATEEKKIRKKENLGLLVQFLSLLNLT